MMSLTINRSILPLSIIRYVHQMHEKSQRYKHFKINNHKFLAYKNII
jgi:hypothetical protein